MRDVDRDPFLERHLAEFQHFYRKLEAKEGIFYLFFTSGLLHWVRHALSFVPESVNVVLIGSGLTSNERAWLVEHVSRPFHHVKMLVDDKTVWEFLFDTNECDFGWMDVDCFVLEPNLFDEMRALESDVSLNCTWSLARFGAVEFAQTYFVFMSKVAIDHVCGEVDVSPSTYSYELTRKSRGTPRQHCHLLSPDLVGRLRSILPEDPAGRPPYLTDQFFYDTLQVYQLIASSLGYRVNKVRALTVGNSDELVHVGKVSYYDRTWAGRHLADKRDMLKVIVQADCLVLDLWIESLPPQYRLRQKQVLEMVSALGLATRREVICDNLGIALEMSGVSRETCSRLFLAPA